MLKSLSYLFYLRANVYLIHDPSASSASLRIDDVEYEGEMKKNEIVEFLEARTPVVGEEGRYYYKDKVTKKGEKQEEEKDGKDGGEAHSSIPHTNITNNPSLASSASLAQNPSPLPLLSL